MRHSNRRRSYHHPIILRGIHPRYSSPPCAGLCVHLTMHGGVGGVKTNQNAKHFEHDYSPRRPKCCTNIFITPTSRGCPPQGSSGQRQLTTDLVLSDSCGLLERNTTLGIRCKGRAGTLRIGWRRTVSTEKGYQPPPQPGNSSVP